MPSIRRDYNNSNATNKQPTGRVNKYHGMYLGIVKDNVDKDKMGRLRVWISEFGSDQNDPSGWRVLNYCSPFAGASPISGVGEDDSDYNQTQTSYGMWMVPPDLETEVAVMFAGGDPARGFWFGCIPQKNMNNMMPGMASSTNYKHPDPAFPKGKNVPVAEYNKKTRDSINNNVSRPVATPAFEGVSKQGLINDNVRGTTTASARREAPSQAYGISTPGPRTNPTDPNNLQRLGGNSFVMDDGVGTESITFRTRSGSQIKIDETNGLIYFINKNGTGWMQLDEDGNVDIFAAEDMSFRSGKDVNIRADRNINIEAGQNVYMKAAKDTDADLNIVGQDAGIGGDIFIQAVNNEHHTVAKNMFITVAEGNMDIIVQAGNKTENINGTSDILVGGALKQESSTLGILSSNYQLNEGGAIGNTGEIISTGIHFAPDFQAPSIGLVAHTHTQGPDTDGNGQVPVNPGTLGGGSSSTTGPAAAIAAVAATKSLISKTNILSGFNDQYRFDRKTQSIQTTVERLPTFEPCQDHKNKGNS